MQAIFYREFGLIVFTQHLFRCVPQLKLLFKPYAFTRKTSLLPYIVTFMFFVQFSRCNPNTFRYQISKLDLSSSEIQCQMTFGGPEWARTTDLTIISRTL